MTRKLADWLAAFCDYASFGEAPRRMYFWAGVSAVAGALRRRVWIDQVYFQWYPNLYILLVAPPGIVSKSTTADIAMSLLRRVPNIRFGPAVVTWQALAKEFAEGGEMFQIGDTFYPMSAMTIVSSEFGNLLNPKDKDMVDMLVNLWDGRPFKKVTKMSGVDEIVNPWINIIACTTPDWIALNVPEYMVGGGFMSRCILVYASEKAKYVPYPALVVPPNIRDMEEVLVHDLEHIATKLAGQYHLTKEAIELGSEWYHHHYKVDAKTMDPVRFGGYIARKQTMAHKVAMVLAAAQRDELVVTVDDLQTAINMLSDLEADMPRVFDRIGVKAETIHIDRLVQIIERRGRMTYVEVYRWMQRYFPKASEIEDTLSTLTRSGVLKLVTDPHSPTDATKAYYELGPRAI